MTSGSAVSFLGRDGLDRLLADDADRRDDRLGVGQDFDVLVNRNVRDVQHVVDAEVRHVHGDDVGDVARVAANLDLAHDLFEDALALAHAFRLAFEVQAAR